MSRPLTIPAEKKLRIVLSVLQGEVTFVEAARREKFSEQAIGKRRRQFLEGDKAGIEAGKSKPTTRELQLEDEVADLTQALGEAAVEIRVWKKSAEGRLGPSRTSR
jgi:transposase